MEKQNKRGVVVIALGSTYYGGLALNLAMSIKTGSYETDITLIYNDSAIGHIKQYIHIFNQTIRIPDDYIKSNGFDALLKSKCYIYDLSPYDETIYLDADTIFTPFKSITLLFEELKDVDFTMGNRGISDLSLDPRLIWVDNDKFIERYGEVKLYNLSSEFIYFKKTELNKAFFDLSKEFYDDPEIEYRMFNGGVPDELAFQLTMIHMEDMVKPHKVPFLPGYWEHYSKKNFTLKQLYDSEFYFYSLGGNQLSGNMATNYDSLVKVYSKGFGIKYPFLSRNKKDVIRARNNV